MTMAAPAARTRQAGWYDARRFLSPAALIVPVLPYVGAGMWHRDRTPFAWWMAPLLVFVVIPILDVIGGRDAGNAPERLRQALEQDRYYRWLTYLYLPLQYGVVVLGAWEWRDGGLGLADRVGLVVSTAVVTGIGINTAHELGHKRESVERRLARIALAPTGYGHFYVEHNRGHHTRVATPEDPASARLGESFYRFWPRTVLGSVRSAWRLERDRLRLRGRPVWSRHNDVLTAWAMTAVLFAALTVAFGPFTLLFLALQGVLGFSMLEIVNYLEHYGLARRRSAETGRYERVDARHSWNNSSLITNIFLFQLQRHSDHHAYPTRRYQVLRHSEVSPQLPFGYATMIVLALLPPVWRRAMDRRVVAHFAGDVTLANLHPPAADRLRERFPGPAAA